MKRHLLLIAGAACLALASGQAAAQCSEEIAELEKTLSSSDAGMGPVDVGSAEDTSAGSMDTSDTPTAGEVPETEATPAMNEAVEGKATSAQDVQRQNIDEPTAAEAAQAGETTPAAGGQTQATAALQRAREHDQAGREDECMEAVEEARQALEVQ